MNLLKCLTTPLKSSLLKKVATEKKYITSKKLRSLWTETINYGKNPRFLIWPLFWPWMTLITSWERVSHVFSILKDKSLPDQYFDTKLVVFNELWEILWSIPLLSIPLFLNTWVLQVSESLIWGSSVWPGITQNWPCPQSGGTSFW